MIEISLGKVQDDEGSEHNTNSLNRKLRSVPPNTFGNVSNKGIHSFGELFHKEFRTIVGCETRDESIMQSFRCEKERYVYTCSVGKTIPEHNDRNVSYGLCKKNEMIDKMRNG